MRLVRLKAAFDKEGNKYHYVLIGTTKEDAEYLRTEKEVSTNVVAILDKEGYLKDNITFAVVAGYLADTENYTALVYKFPKRTIDIKDRRPDEYRDYTQTIEKQKEILWLVNVAECAAVSWKTAILACGSQYGVVLKMIVERVKPKTDEQAVS